jgi:uncharacterized protein YukE
MTRIQVQPEELSGQGAEAAELAGRLAELSGRLEQVVAQAVASAGEPNAANAIEASGDAWGTSLTALVQAVGGLGRNLDAAANAYTTTDAGVMPASGGDG